MPNYPVRNTEFDQTQFDRAYPIGVERHYWQRARAAIVADQLRRHDLTTTTFLEIGCGRGTFLHMLRRRGLRLDGVELAPVTPDPAVRGGIRTGVDATTLPEIQRRTYTGLMLFDVIEHIENPADFLTDLLLHFPNVQHLALTVPARPELWSNYDEYYGHYRRYTFEDIRALCAALPQVSLVHQHYFFHALYAPARLLSERPLAVKAPKGIANVVHSLLGKLFYWEYKLLPNGLPGTSILAILQVRRPAT